MARVRVLDESERRIGPSRATDALDLARRLPRLALEARRISAAVAHGVHGRRRPGTGETFWQFRPFTAGEPAHRIDWRRSARDEHHLHVREREWEAAHTVRLWIDRSPSMAFASALAAAPKLDRAVVLGLALADLLVRGGDRVGLLGFGPTMASRMIVDRLAEALAADPSAEAELPDATPLPPLSEAVLITDALSPADEIAGILEKLAARGARGHLLRIVDPVEETFPFEGQAELLATEGRDRLDVGDAGAFRRAYHERMQAHRSALAEACRRRGWSFLDHRTDRPASEALLAVAVRVARGGRGPGSF